MTKSTSPAKSVTPRKARVSEKQAVVPARRSVSNATLDVSALASAAISMGKWSVAANTSADLVDALHLQTEQLKKGDMTNVEEMLYCQAVTLQSVFAKTLQHAMSSESMKHQTTVLTLAFKAQAQCRATLETLANIKNPRAVAFVRQANIAQNQQVNNNGAGEFVDNYARAREKTLPIEQNELFDRDESNAGLGGHRKQASAQPHRYRKVTVGTIERRQSS